MKHFDILKKGNDETTNFIIESFSGHSHFEALSQKEAERLIKRDQEDEELLQRGVEKAIARGLSPRQTVGYDSHKILVEGKNATAVAKEILKKVKFAEDKRGELIVLHGRSGTGKGTTVARLSELLPRSRAWSNGDIFRSLTYLAVRESEKQGKTFGPHLLDAVLLDRLIKMLHFGKHRGEYDILIKGHGDAELVSEIKQTKLMEPKVAERIPTVAHHSQGEVIRFASRAIDLLRDEHRHVILEGRKVTLDYFFTTNRFELHVEDTGVLGARRAAQRLAAAMAHKLDDKMTDKKTRALLERTLGELK